MNGARLLETFLDLVRIESPSRKEAAVAAYCRDALEQAGCLVRIDDTASQTGADTGNLIAVLPGTAPGAALGVAPGTAPGTALGGAPGGAPSFAPATAPGTAPARLYFSAHMDTVTPCEGITPVITDGIIRSADDTILSADDKAGIAAIIELIRTLSEDSKPHPEIVVLLSVCEEISLLGSQAMDTGGFAGEPCFVLDGDGKPGTVVIGAPYHFKFTATFTGRAAHSGVEPEKGLSAIRIAARAILDMELGRLDENTTANVGMISGGHAFNIIPDTCTLTGEFRVFDEQRMAKVKTQLETAMRHAVAAMGGEVAVDWVASYCGFKLTEDDPVVQLVLDEASKLGLEAKTRVSGGGSDANVYTGGGLKALVLATGMTDVHGPDESLAIADLENLVRLCIAVAYSYG